MSDNGHSKNSISFTTRPGPKLRHPSFSAALEAARPTLLRLYKTWHHRRQARIAEYAASFSSTYGHPPTADDVVAGLEPRISLSVATWYLVRNNGHRAAGNTSGNVAGSIPDFSK
jgi:hypothetical protein